MRHAYGTTCTSVPLRVMMGLYVGLLVMVPKTVAVPVEARADLADLVGASDFEQDAYMMEQEPDDATAPRAVAAAPSMVPWRTQPSAPGSGNHDLTISAFVADFVRAFGWQPVIYLGSFGGALLVMLIAWWRIARAVTLDNRHRPPDWDMY